MAKAVSRIKVGVEGREERDVVRGKFVEPGENVPAKLAEAAPWAVEEKEFKRTLDPSKPKTLEGEDAAAESILTRPDNPNRPSSIEGEDAWKVSRDAHFGRPEKVVAAPRPA